ncbi:MAG: VOC family protein [Verrucomicrobia bacterium]|nr:VOC family protein [Verrucomicrobiota bacterium]
MSVNPIPSDCPALCAYLHVAETARLIEFLKIAFGGVEVGRVTMPDGQIAHARVTLGGAMVMMSLAHPPFPPSAVMLYHYVADVDAAYARALVAGAESVFAPMPTFYGDRLAVVKDFAGNHWALASRVEDITLAEVQKRVSGFVVPPAA